MIQQTRSKYLLFFVIVLVFLTLLTGCSKPARNEIEILRDLYESGSLFSLGGELDIKGCNITKRRTDEKNFSDVIYLDVFASNDDIDCTLSYIMYYELYNDGWILEKVERDYEGQWRVVPLHGMTDKQLQEKLDYCIRMGWYDTVKLIDRDTELTDMGCTETATFLGTKDHLYGVEQFTLTQTWYFDSQSCRYTSVGADPLIVERNLIYKDTIVGATWNSSRYDSFDPWPDQFMIRVDELRDEEDGTQSLLLYATRERNTYWDMGSNEAVYWATYGIGDVTTYLEYDDNWAFSLWDLRFLFSDDDDERFTQYSWFRFNLDYSGVGHIIESEIGLSDLQSDNDVSWTFPPI